MRTSCMETLALAAFAVATASAHADTIAIGGSTITLSATTISFRDNDGAGRFEIGSSSTGAYAPGAGFGIFAPITSGAPVVPGFVQIATLPNAQFTLTSIGPGSPGSAQCFAPAAAGQVCSLPGSPLVWINTWRGAVAAFSVAGTVLDTATGSQGTFAGAFAATFGGQTYQSLLADVAAGGTLEASYSASLRVFSDSFGGLIDVGASTYSLSNTLIDFTAPGEVGPTSTGIFAPLAGTQVTANDIASAGPSVSGVPVLAAAPNDSFTLTALDPGVFNAAGCFTAPAAFETCTPTGSPLGLLNLPFGFVSFFSGLGTFTDVASSATAPYDVLFASALADPLSYQLALARLAGGSSLSSSYAADVVVGPIPPRAVPEPGTAALLLSALLLAVGAWRSRAQRRGQDAR